MNQDHAHGTDALPFSDHSQSFGCRGFNINTAGINFKRNRQIFLHAFSVGAYFRGFSENDGVDILDGKTLIANHCVRLGEKL